FCCFSSPPPATAGVGVATGATASNEYSVRVFQVRIIGVSPKLARPRNTGDGCSRSGRGCAASVGGSGAEAGNSIFIGAGGGGNTAGASISIGAGGNVCATGVSIFKGKETGGGSIVGGSAGTSTPGNPGVSGFSISGVATGTGAGSAAASWI